jgi:hypothetical protein
MHTVIWWGIWGLVVGAGLFGLKESSRNNLHLLLAVPLLSAAAAAAAARMKHGYHEAMAHAKWVAVISPFLLVGMGYLYLRAEGFGPFSGATANRAFLQATFGMSIPEVERAIGHGLIPTEPDKFASPELHEWILDRILESRKPHEERLLPNLAVYHEPCQARFAFFDGRLGKVEIDFDRLTKEEAATLMQQIDADLSRTYSAEAAQSPADTTTRRYKKESVEASVLSVQADPLHQVIEIIVTYLPLTTQQTDPVALNAQVF